MIGAVRICVRAADVFAEIDACILVEYMSADCQGVIPKKYENRITVSSTVIRFCDETVAAFGIHDGNATYPAEKASYRLSDATY